MRTVFRARLKPDGPRATPWTHVGGVMEAQLSGRDLHVIHEPGGNYMVVGGEDSHIRPLSSWFIHESDLDLFESWVEWPEGAQLVSSTYSAERFLPGVD